MIELVDFYKCVSVLLRDLRGEKSLKVTEY